jgi:hypothetical protein
MNMPEAQPPHTRRSFLAASAALTAATTGAFSLLPARAAGVTADGADGAAGDAIRPFHINVPERDLLDLRSRVKATRWPARETVSDQSQGVRLAKIQELVGYWGTRYDWRKVEARLNAQPQFVTQIDWARYSLHARPLSSRGRAAVDHDPWLAGVGAGVAEGHRAAH